MVSLIGATPRPHHGRSVVNTWALDILDGQIQTIRSVINPDKLGHVGPVADAWAVVREANRARRPIVPFVLDPVDQHRTAHRSLRWRIGMNGSSLVGSGEFP
jgi:hypothetical protein